MRLIRILIIFLLTSHLSQASELKTIISTIPSSDLQDIKSIFKNLFDNQRFSYSLYGDKSLSFSDFSLSQYSGNDLLNFLSLDQCCESILEIYSEPASMLKRKWTIWEKYRHLFKTKKIFIFSKTLSRSNSDFFINKEAMQKTLNNNLFLKTC
jgi:hypothetical protein